MRPGTSSGRNEVIEEFYKHTRGDARLIFRVKCDQSFVKHQEQCLVLIYRHSHDI